MSKTSQWAGYIASFFAIAFFVTVTAFRGGGGEVPGWFAVVTGWCMMLAALSGVVCLVSALFAYLRLRQNGAVASRFPVAHLRRAVPELPRSALHMMRYILIIFLTALVSVLGCTAPRHPTVAKASPRSEAVQARPSYFVVPYPLSTAYDYSPTAREAFMDAFRTGYIDGLYGTWGWHCTPSESVIAVAACSGRNQGQVAGFRVYSDRKSLREFSQSWRGWSEEQIAELLEKKKQWIREDYRREGKSEEWIRDVLSE